MDGKGESPAALQKGREGGEGGGGARVGNGVYDADRLDCSDAAVASPRCVALRGSQGAAVHHTPRSPPEQMAGLCPLRAFARRGHPKHGP